jgi:predicted acylesterase/phospholipase RssA
MNARPVPKTTFFSTCLGVFQGGGCRGAALAGAYAEANRLGVHFTQVAGTSAGSIVAALIGAGASPERVLNAVQTLNFMDLLRPPERQQSGDSRLFRFGLSALQLCGSGRFRDLGLILRWGGLYSSEALETWIDKQLTLALAEIVPDPPKPVRFRDLPVPTYVVATDLQGSKAKVWSTFDTPDDAVAFAVRASCSIPFFFQPVHQGQNRFVDGGVLSNLPSFVFFADEDTERPMAARVLAFQLTSESTLPERWSTLETARRVGNAVVDGATELQGRLQPDVSVIKIPTPGVRATDFDKMNPVTIDSLVEIGRRKTEEFIRGELTRTSKISPRRTLCYDDDDVYGLVASHAERARDIVISLDAAEWIWKLFPTMLLWKLQPEASVRALLGPITDTNQRARANELARRALLRNIGVSVTEVPDLPFRGFLLNGADPRDPTAVIYSTRRNDYLPTAVCYDGQHHYDVVSAFHQRAVSLLGPSDTYNPSIVPYDAEQLCAMLKQVAQYRSPGVAVSVETVRVKDLLMVSQYIREWKYRQMDRLIGVYQSQGFELFAPLAVRLKDDTLSIIGPPVVEESNTQFAIIEGHTRCTHCRINKAESVRAVVVRGLAGDQKQLPAPPVPIAYGTIVSRRRPQKRWEYQFLRRIEEALHPVPRIEQPL